MTRIPPLTIQADHVARELEGLGDRVATKYLRNAVRAGAIVVRTRARELAGGDRRIRKALTVKANRYRKGDAGGPTASVGYKKGSAGRRIAHWREFGTALRQTRTGAGRGRVQARPVLRPALDTTQDAQYDAIYNRLKEQVDGDYGRG